MREVLARADGIIRFEEEEFALSKGTAATIAALKHPYEMIQGPRTNFPNGRLRNQARTNSPPAKLTIKDKPKEKHEAELVTNKNATEEGLWEINAIHELPQSLERVGIILFTQRDLEGIQFPHNGALGITLQIGNSKVKRVMIDSESSVEVIGEVSPPPYDNNLSMGKSLYPYQSSGDEVRNVTT
ncbi:unnamed protein product [Prunus brigantina]